MFPNYPPEQSTGLTAWVARYPEFRKDPNDFIPFVFSSSLHNVWVQAAIHRQLQTFLSTHRRALVELPRDHGKTSQICGRILFELALNPRLRVKIVCSNDAIASERTRFIRDTIETNLRLRAMFPHLKSHRPWSPGAFTILRDDGVLGPSVAAIGIGARSTGTRADLLICDDIVDVRAILFQRDRSKVRMDFENNLLNLLEPDGRFWGLYTPWHSDDLNAHLKKNKSYALFRKPIDEDLTSIWPEKWPTTALAARRDEIGTAAFARGYRLLPVAEDDVAIKLEWVKYWYSPAPAFDRIILSIDPAVTTNQNRDATGIVVLGKTKDVVYCLSAKAYRLKWPDLKPVIDQLHSQWQPDAICFEANASFLGLKDYLQRDPQYGHKIVGIHAKIKKETRIHAFSVYVERGLFLLKGNFRINEVDSKQKELFIEMTNFPFDDHDDLADAAAMGTEYLMGTSEVRTWKM